ncbi:MAG TPA: hypothetical protein PK314_07370, partial [Deltaproteobacteria bacterium]|nr:hypothetical protein [Deltaproteobacteria bacterium]
SLIKPAVFLLITLLVLLFVIRPLLKWLSKSVRVIEEEPEKTKALAEAEGAGEIEAREIPQLESAGLSDENKQTLIGKVKAIEKSSRSDMDTATAVVKSWLQESL